MTKPELVPLLRAPGTPSGVEPTPSAPLGGRRMLWRNHRWEPAPVDHMKLLRKLQRELPLHEPGWNR